MKTLILTTAILISCVYSYAEETFSGRDMQCHSIGYLSSECKGAKAVPYYMTNEDIALAKAKTADNIMQISSKTETHNYEMTVSGEPVSDKVNVKSYFEDEPVTYYK